MEGEYSEVNQQYSEDLQNYDQSGAGESETPSYTNGTKSGGADDERYMRVALLRRGKCKILLICS